MGDYVFAPPEGSQCPMPKIHDSLVISATRDYISQQVLNFSSGCQEDKLNPLVVRFHICHLGESNQNKKG